jgi:hypothetical protein
MDMPKKIAVWMRIASRPLPVRSGVAKPSARQVGRRPLFGKKAPFKPQNPPKTSPVFLGNAAGKLRIPLSVSGFRNLCSFWFAVIFDIKVC